jgi:hypothetical protein
MRLSLHFAFYATGLDEHTKDRQLRMTVVGFCKLGMRSKAWKKMMKLDT